MYLTFIKTVRRRREIVIVFCCVMQYLPPVNFWAHLDVAACGTYVQAITRPYNIVLSLKIWYDKNRKLYTDDKAFNEQWESTLSTEKVPERFSILASDMTEQRLNHYCNNFDAAAKYAEKQGAVLNKTGSFFVNAKAFAKAKRVRARLDLAKGKIEKVEMDKFKRKFDKIIKEYGNPIPQEEIDKLTQEVSKLRDEQGELQKKADSAVKICHGLENAKATSQKIKEAYAEFDEITKQIGNIKTQIDQLANRIGRNSTPRANLTKLKDEILKKKYSFEEANVFINEIGAQIEKYYVPK
jgi:hypothetical protein